MIMPVLKHHSLLNLLDVYFKNAKHYRRPKGICFGFSAKFIDAYLLRDEKRFWQRLKLIYCYEGRYEHLLKQIKSYSFFSIGRRPEDKAVGHLLEIPSFIESVYVQQHPNHLSPIMGSFNFLPKNQSITTYHSVIKPSRYGNTKIHSHFRHHHRLNKRALVAYFDALMNKLMQANQETYALMINSNEHATVVVYDRNEKCWQHIDVNRLLLYNDSKGLLQFSPILGNSHQLVDSLYLSHYGKKVDKPFSFFIEALSQGHQKQAELKDVLKDSVYGLMVKAPWWAVGGLLVIASLYIYLTWQIPKAGLLFLAAFVGILYLIQQATNSEGGQAQWAWPIAVFHSESSILNYHPCTTFHVM